MILGKNKLTFPALFSEALEHNSSRPALGFVGEEMITYAELSYKIKCVSSFLLEAGIKKGDKIAIYSQNMPQWGITYFAITFIGAVAVPILPDFTVSEANNILEHSGSKMLFMSEAMERKFSESGILPTCETLVRLENFEIFSGGNLQKIDFLTPSDLEFNVDEDDLASIIYTSGTTGKSKGVMLTHKNISYVAVASETKEKIVPGDRFLSLLPLSHTYENTLGFVMPMINGATVYYLRKMPTPAVLLPALEMVKPTVLLTVPLIMEKIYKAKIEPVFSKNQFIKTLYNVGFIRRFLNRKAGLKLKKTFGGELRFYGIGGAKINPKVEQFLLEAKFPYAIGYGLTETAPVLAGTTVATPCLESTGTLLEGVALRISNPDSITGEGEIQAYGPNVMKGYYNEPELTKDVFTDDGWFRTGDLGTFDNKGNLYIKRRLKNVIIGSSGENIYPEEIETIINNFRFVVESVVVEQKGKLVALVHFNRDELEKQFIHLREGVKNYVDAQIDALVSELTVYVNHRVNKFSRVQLVVAHPTPFQKTATQKIKRFLYT